METCGRLKQMTKAQIHKSLRCSLSDLGQTDNPHKYSLTIWMSENCWDLRISPQKVFKST